jgi:integrase/recombinase XerD
MVSGKVEGKGQARVLTIEQIKTIIEYAREPYRYPIAIAAYTGCRMGEAIALRAENLLDDAIVFTRTKTGETRSVPLHPGLKAILAAATLPTSGYLFPSNGGKSLPHITRQAVDKELRSVCKDLGLDGVGTHSFRRSVLTTMKDKNIPIKNIAAISGHKSLDELSRYLEVSEGDKERAIASLGY